MTWRNGCSARCPTAPGCIPATTTTPGPALSGRTCPSGGPAAGSSLGSSAQRAGPGSADFRAVDNDVAEVIVRGVVVRATTGDQVQLGIGYRAVDGGRGEVRLRVLMHRGDPEDGVPAVRLTHVDLVARAQLAQPVEDPWAPVGIDVPSDDRRADLAWPRAAGIPAGHGGAAGHLQRALPGEAQPGQPGA